MKNFSKYLLKKIGIMLLTLWLIVTCTFFLIHSLPGSPYVNQEKLTPAQLEILNRQAGLDRPITEQYFIYFKNLLHGDLGTSFQFKNQPVAKLLINRVGPSVQLGLQAIVVGTVLGVIFGIISAMKQNTWADSIVTIIAILGRSIPNFIFAVVLQYIFAVRLGLLPIALWNGFSYTILPTITLAMAPMANSARFIRTEMVEVLNSDYIELARSKGLNRWQTAFRHGLRNSLIPLITLLGPMAVSLMTGSLVVENIYAVPGIGEQFVKSIITNDYPTIMAITILYSVMLVLVIFVVDLLYGLVDPRIRVTGGA
ncbi:MAG: ABC transporter permease [Christensenellaceae bacterium]|jgi:oligopeptide transport system permease protein|nr:ABC transporter permease [Christensenellaceae bacterium]